MSLHLAFIVVVLNKHIYDPIVIPSSRFKRKKKCVGIYIHNITHLPVPVARRYCNNKGYQSVEYKNESK